jgi:hypothetical protein
LERIGTVRVGAQHRCNEGRKNEESQKGRHFELWGGGGRFVMSVFAGLPVNFVASLS